MAAAAPPAPEAGGTRGRRSARRGAWWVFLVFIGLLLVLAGLVAGIGTWAWNSESAQRRVLLHVPGLTLEGSRGRLNGGAFAADLLRWESADVRVEVDGLNWSDAVWRWRPHAGAWLGLSLTQPQAQAVRITRKPSPPQAAEPLRAPSDLRLPLELLAQGLKLGVLQLDGATLVTELQADLHVGADNGTRHRIDRLALTRAPMQLAGQASIDTTGDLPLQAEFDIGTAAGTPESWRATLRAQGPLQRLDVNANLRVESGAALSAAATATPFADWPLAALALQTRDLNLAVLAPELPETKLSGSVKLADVTAGQPLQLVLSLANGLAGPWDAGRLPLRSARGTLQGRPSEPDRLSFDGLELALGRDGGGGAVSGSGRWQTTQLELALKLQGVQPAQLDSRAPAGLLDGSVALALQGLALPGSTAPAAANAPRGDLQGSVQTQLRGRASARGKGSQPLPPLDVQADLAFRSPADATLQVELKRFEAKAGAARARATLQARRDAAMGWAMKSEGSLQRFDIAAWWPAATAGRSSDLNGSWQADLQLAAPPAASAAPAADPLAQLRGNAQLTLKDSTLAGVPLSGAAALNAPGRGLALDARLRAAANDVRVKGTLIDAVHDWTGHVQAPSLAALAPLLTLLPGTQGFAPSTGSLQGSANAKGRWPALRSEGLLDLQALRTPQLQVQRGRARWSFNGTALDAPLAFDAELDGVAQAERRLDRLQAKLAGSLRNHRLTLEASSPVRPPAWAETVSAAAAGTAPPGSALNLDLQGAWQPASGSTPATLGAGEWRGTLMQLRAAPRTAGAAPWLLARDIKAHFSLDAMGRARQAMVAPGRIDAFGGALVWQQARWQAPARPGDAPEMAIEARLEPLQIAPVLARLQPAMGWQGDLAVGARASVRSAARFDADIVIERAGGDLGLTVAGTPRTLGLSQLRVALAAHDGRWQATQTLSGAALGTLSGSQTLSAPVDAAVPPSQAPLQGGAELRVPDVAVWATWLPPGWRLGGALQANAVLGGTLGTPTYRGAVAGDRLDVRNIFEGINLTEGTVRVALNSSEAVIERIDFQGAGGGTMHLEGRAALNGPPQLTMKLVTDKFRALDRVDRRVALSGSADIGLRAGRLSVNGRYTVDEGLIDVSAADAPSLDEDILVVGRTDVSGKPVAVVDGGKTANDAPLAGADIDLRVGLGEALRLRGRGLDTRLRGQLRVSTTPAGALAVRGVVNTVDGTYTAYGQNLSIERGTISFTDEVANPRLDILALRADIDMRVGVVVSGYAIAPRVRLYSDPDLPELDQITWLLTGRAPEGEGRDESALLQRAALALLAGDKGASSEGFLQKLGVDQFGVGRTDGGDTVVTIGKQLSKRLSVAYEKGLAAAGGTWQLLYRVAGRTTLRASAGTENAIDVIWSWRWD